MPFHIPHHHHSQSDSSNFNHENQYSAVNALYQSGQTLGSIGVPTVHSSSNNKTAASAVNDQRFYAQHFTNGAPAIGSQNPADRPIHSYSQEYSHPSRSNTFSLSRQPEELHIPQQGSEMSDVHHYGAPPSYNNESGSGNSQIPGQLQPGLPTRLNMHMGATHTGPSIPTLPHIQTQMQQQQQQQSQSQTSLSARPSVSHSHSHTRSSPGVMDSIPKYKPFTNKTPETSKYISPPTSYSQPPPLQSGQIPSSYSPLGLADIRPRADTVLSLSDTTFSPRTTIESDIAQYPSNSSYIAPWPIYAVDWCKWTPKGTNAAAGKVAIGSYLEDNHNYIQILDAQKTQTDPENPHGERGIEFTKVAEATHSYPVTRILWEPPSSNKQSTDLLATSGDHLRLWSLPAEQTQQMSNTIGRSKDAPLQKLSPLALLSNSKSPEHTAPITSLDWNVVQPSLIITSSIDTTCTIWDIPTLTAKTQLIAHDKEVFDVRFCANSVDVFVSCGADGSVRMFDLRSLEHSTIIYEPSEKADKGAQLSPDPLSVSPTRGSSHSLLSFPPPLLRIAASPHDSHLLATFSQESSSILILDVRQPGQALLELKGHGTNVNCIEWSNNQRGLLASGADDCCVMLWDLMASSGASGTTSSTSSINIPSVTGQVIQSGTGGTAAAAAAAATTAQAATVGQERGPSAVWDCGYEVSNLSWSPVSGTVGVCGGKGFWGVQL